MTRCTVDAVEGGVELGAGEPSVLVPRFVGLQYLVPALEPVDQLRCACTPEVIGVFQSSPADGVGFVLTADPRGRLAVLGGEVATLLG